MTLADAGGMLKEAYVDWKDDNAARVAAALSYYTTLSLAPLIVISIAIVGAFFGRDAAQGQIVGQIQGLVGPNAAAVIEALIESAARPAEGLLAGSLSVLTLLMGAAGVFGQLQDALNTVWEAPPRPRRGWLAIVRDRFLSFSVLLGTGFLLLVSLLISAGLSALGASFSSALPLAPVVVQCMNLIVSFGVITVLFAMIYEVLPDVDVGWRNVWVGAALTAFLFVVGKSLIGLYLGHGSFASAYGAAGSIVVILVWIYYSAQIFLYGAELTQVVARRRRPHGGRRS
jgi:membrane protein